MAWRLARSLEVLRAEVRELHPGTTVWTIGDQDHQASASDHNPNAADVVCASDTLGDRGLNLGWYAERVRQAGIGGHPAPKYVIYNRRIASRSRGWTWRAYGGSNPHTGHVHVSVGTGPDGRSTGPYDDRSPWGLLQEDSMPTVREIFTTDGILETPDLAAGGGKRPDAYLRDNPHWHFATYIKATYENVARAVQAGRQARDGNAAILAAIAGQDVAQAAADAARAAVREELAGLGDELGGALLAELGPALLETLGDAAGELPAAVVEAAVARALARTSLTVEPAGDGEEPA